MAWHSTSKIISKASNDIKILDIFTQFTSPFVLKVFIFYFSGVVIDFPKAKALAPAIEELLE